MLPLHTVGFHLFTQHLFLCRVQVIGKRLILDPAAIERDLQRAADPLALHIVVGVDIQRMVVFIGFYERTEHFVDVETRNDIKIQYSVIHRLDAILEIKIPRSESARCCQILTIQPVEEDAPACIFGNLSFLKGRFRSFRVALSGAQGYFGVVPDLTVFGKIVAGGYPSAGGVGGKKEYAQLMAAGLATGKHRAYVGGTLAANPLSCLAGYTAIREIERTNACEIAGKMGDRLCDGLKGLLDRYGLPFVAYNQGSIVHLECTGAMSFDFSSMSFAKSAVGLLKHKDMMYVRKDSMERMGAAYMANGIVTLAGSRLYTSMADTPEIIDEALNRFEEVFKHVRKTNKGLLP